MLNTIVEKGNPSRQPRASRRKKADRRQEKGMKGFDQTSMGEYGEVAAGIFIIVISARE